MELLRKQIVPMRLICVTIKFILINYLIDQGEML